MSLLTTGIELSSAISSGLLSARPSAGTAR